ncbi:rod shape-determining protein MreD [Candidatus Marinimicrobia bacterium]|nr:rod shape-determining protein MreD [Candidatus Neomarinimicrobiota bacterium]
MIVFQYFIIIFVTFLFQSWTSEFFSLGTIDPDFCLIVLLYISIKNGGLVGTLFGFFIGLFIDLSSGTNQFFGLTPLVYTVTGYSSAFLKGQNEKLNKLYFSSLWVFIILCQFLIFSLVVYQQLLVDEPTQFLIKWLATSLYTLVFLGILQIMVPLYKI